MPTLDQQRAAARMRMAAAAQENQQRPIAMLDNQAALTSELTSDDPDIQSGFSSAVRRNTTNAYISSMLGMNADTITPETYTGLAKRAGLSGNAEADASLVINNLEKNRVDFMSSVLQKDVTQKTNTFLRDFITNGFRGADEALTGALKKASGGLANFFDAPFLNQAEDELTGRIDILQARVDKKGSLDYSDPDVIELRQATVKRDVIRDTRTANKRQGLFYKQLEESEAMIRAGRVFEAEETLGTTEEHEKTLTAKFLSGLGSFSYSMSSFALGGPIVGMAANTATIYQETVDDAREHGATEAEAFDAGVISLPSGVATAAIEKVLFARLLKPLQGKMTVGEVMKNIGLSITAGGGSEGSEQLWQNVNSKYLSQYDPNRPLDESILAAIAMGAIFGGAPAVTSVAQLVPGFGKIRTADPSDAEWDLIRKFETDDQILQNRGGPIALAAANGDLDARIEHHKLVTSTQDVGDQPFGPMRQEKDLTAAEIKQINEGVPRTLDDLKDHKPVVNEVDSATIDFQQELDAVARDTEGRVDEEPAELTSEQKQLANVELKQALAELDPVETGDKELSKVAKELADLELAEAEPAVDQQLTKEEKERLAAGLEVEPSVQSEKVDKKAAKFFARIVKLEDKFNAKIAKLKQQLKKNHTEAKAKKLEQAIKLKQKIADVKKLAALSKSDALKRQAEKASVRLGKEVAKRLNVVRKNLADRKNLVKATKDLKAIIQELPRSIRGDLNALFPKLSGKVSQEAQLKVLREALARVDAKIEGFVKIEQKKALAKTIVKGIKVKGKELHVFKRIKEIAGMDRTEALELQAKLAEQENPSDADVLTIHLLGKYGGLMNTTIADGTTAKEMTDAAKEAASIFKAGKFLMKERLEERKADDKKKQVDAAQGVLGNEAPMSAREINTRNDNKKDLLGLKSIGEGISNFDTRMQSYEWLLDKLTSEGKDLKGPLQRYHRAASKASNRTFIETNKAMQKTEDAMEEIIFGGKVDPKNRKEFRKNKKKLAKILKEWAKSRLTPITFVNKKGSRVQQHFSKSQAISLWMQWQDKSLSKTFENMGVDETTMRQVGSHIGADGRAMGDFFMEHYREQFERINEVHRNVEGYDLRAVANYSPIHREGDPTATEDGFLAHANPIATARNASLISRTNNHTELRFDDAFNEFATHVAKMEHYIAHAEVARDLRVVFQSPQVKNAIVQTAGKEAYSTLKRFNDDIINGGVAAQLKWQLWDKIRAGLTKSSLALKPSIFVKQLASIPAYVDAIPTGEWTKGAADFWTHPTEAIRIMQEAEYIQQRMSEGFDRDVKDAIKGFDKSKMANVESITDRMMFLTKLGDMAAVYQGGWPVYLYHYNRAIKAGKTESEAKLIGLEEFELATARSQQSSRLLDLGEMQRGNSLGKMFTMYMTAPASYYRLEIAAFRNMKKGRMTKKQFMKRFGIYHLLLPNIFQALSSGLMLTAFDDEEQMHKLMMRQVRASVIGSFNGVLVFGDALESIVDKFVGDKNWGQNISMLDMLTEMSEEIGNLPAQIEEDGVTAETLMVLYPFLEAKGIPIDTITTWFEVLASDDDATEATLNFIGWSDYALAEESDD